MLLLTSSRFMGFMTRTRTNLTLAAAGALAATALLSVAAPTYTQLADRPSQTATTDVTGGHVVLVDEGVNDQGQTSGDIFTQNAQDQSSA